MDPRAPTRHPPGSAGKLRVLALRASLGLPLFHPLDAGGRGRRRETGLSVRVRSLPPGVSYDAARGRYRVRLCVNGRREHVGWFRTLAEAVAALAPGGGGAV